jgi:20S proteasome alpha/beta subunit
MKRRLYGFIPLRRLLLADRPPPPEAICPLASQLLLASTEKKVGPFGVALYNGRRQEGMIGPAMHWSGALPP